MGYSKVWIDILNEVDNFASYDVQDMVWFRGHSNLEYELHSGLFRVDHRTLDKFLMLERILYRKFVNLGHLHHNETDWNLLYLMQHHGVVTRLLDWSESFNVALFFACNGWVDDNCACIWLLRTGGLNKASTGDTVLKFPREGDMLYENHIFNKETPFGNNSVALYPLRNSSRVVAQQGAFTLQGNSMLPLDQEHNGRLLDEGNLKKIILPPDIRDEVKRYLQVSGVNYYTLFPDLDGLSKYINEPYIKAKRIPAIPT